MCTSSKGDTVFYTLVGKGNKDKQYRIYLLDWISDPSALGFSGGQQLVHEQAFGAILRSDQTQ